MCFPFFKRRQLFIPIRMAIIDGRDARDDAALVVQHRLDDVRLHAHHCHVGCDGTADVMQTPVIGA